MAKAKTPSSGSDKPKQTSTSRASSAAKSKTAAKSTAKPAAQKPSDTAQPSAASKPEATTPKAASAKSEPVISTPTETPKAAAAPKTEPAKPAQSSKPAETTKSAVTPETQQKVETGDITKDADKKPEAAKPAASTQMPKTSASKPVTTSASTASTAATSAPASEKRPSVFFPMLLGGIVAGAIGFAAAEYNVFGLRDQDAPAADAAMTDVNDRLSALEQANADAADQPAAIAPDSSAADGAIEEIRTSLSDLSARVEELASREPSASASEPVDTSAFEEELATLKNSVEAQRDEIQRLLDNALSVEEATAQAAQAATAQSAIARIVAAVTNGQPFAEEVSELQANGIADVPAPLTEVAENGVATSASLQDRFPDAARAALAEARANGEDETNGGVAGFFKTQLGARSVTPREGNDPDAILSRAEAAVRDGRLDDALTEIEALPEPAKAPLADWIADAKARQSAQDALDTLTQRLTAN